ncbi:hypothetical protein ACNOYE_07105 [Nannocystaceae bacterium ST9]
MSAAEIQDNKWEVQASKPNFFSPAAIGAIIMMAGFILFFVALIIGSVQGTFTESGGMVVDKEAAASKDAADKAAE